MNQIKQIIQTFNVTRQHDPSVVPAVALGAGGALVLCLVLGFVLGPLLLWIPLALFAMIATALIILGRKAQSASLAAIEGQAGAAAAVLQSMRGAWEITPAVAFNRREDMIHLAVGPPGVVLVAEGTSPARVKQLMAKERRRFDHMAKLPRAIKPKEVGPLNRKLSALKASAPPMPKGPQMRRAPKKYR